MKFRFQKIEVRMGSGASIVPLTVPEWELPVIQAIHDEVMILGEVVVEREPLSVSGEFSRLQLCYGSERNEGGKTGVSYVESVYGQHGAGIAALKKVMQASVLPAKTPVTPVAASPTLRQDVLQAISGDAEEGDLIGEADVPAEDADTVQEAAA